MKSIETFWTVYSNIMYPCVEIKMNPREFMVNIDGAGFGSRNVPLYNFKYL